MVTLKKTERGHLPTCLFAYSDTFVPLPLYPSPLTQRSPTHKESSTGIWGQTPPVLVVVVVVLWCFDRPLLSFSPCHLPQPSLRRGREGENNNDKQKMNKKK